jgi:transposase InsO family protein
MELARYVVDAVVLEGRSYRDVARAHGVSKSWVAKIVGRYRAGGYDAVAPRSRAPDRIPHRTPPEVEDAIVALRKELADAGLDAGAETIAHHLIVRTGSSPSVSTVWRVLRRRGFVTPQPHKRPRSSWIRFEATLPNECWQSDTTHWRLADGSDVEICNLLDDHSRLLVASRVMAPATAPAVLEAFRAAAERWGLPASVLTDNGCVYTSAYRHGRSAMESELLALGIVFKHSRPYHPQTCGKVERVHQTMKRFLAKQPPAETLEELQAQVDRFVGYYNEVRPHRSLGRRTPRQTFEARDRARPSAAAIAVGRETRVRHDRIDKHGSVTVRYRSKLHHVGVGRRFRGTPVVVLVDGLDIRVITHDGEVLRQLTLDPMRDYQPTGKTGSGSKVSTMS